MLNEEKIRAIIWVITFFLNKVIYNQIRKRRAERLSWFLSLQLVIWIVLAGLENETSLITTSISEGIIFAFIVGLYIIRQDRKERVLPQLLERRRREYHSLTGDYDVWEYSWRTTKELCSMLDDMFSIIATYADTKQLDIKIVVRKELEEDYVIDVRIKNVDTEYITKDYTDMRYEIEKSVKTLKNITLKVAVEEYS